MRQFVCAAFSMVLLGTGVAEAAESKKHTSSLGYTIEVPEGWTILSREEVRDNPDLFEAIYGKLPAGVSADLIRAVKDSIASGNLEMYIAKKAPGAVFANNVNIGKEIGHIPEAPSEVEKFCHDVPGELVKAYGRKVTIANCEPRRVAGHAAIYLEFGGMMVGTTSMQYQVEKSPSITVDVTATCSDETIETCRATFGKMMSSLTFP